MPHHLPTMCIVCNVRECYPAIWRATLSTEVEGHAPSWPCFVLRVEGHALS